MTTHLPFALGAMSFGNIVDEATSFALLDRFVEAGGTWIDTAYMVFKACVAVGLWGAASIGYFTAKLAWWERVLAAAASFLLIAAAPITDQVGFALAALFLLVNAWRRRRARLKPLRSA